MEVYFATVLFVVVFSGTSSSTEGRVIDCHESPGNLNTLTVILRNAIQEPVFNVTAQLVVERPQPFVYYLQKAIDVCEEYAGMEGSYFGSLGWLINSFNDVESEPENNGTYWSFLISNDQFSQIGASSYIPQRGDVITMNFTAIDHYSENKSPGVDNEGLQDNPKHASGASALAYHNMIKYCAFIVLTVTAASILVNV